MKTETMTPSERGGTLPPLIVRLAGLWILAGALFKLLQGTPNDLPQIVRDFPLELGLTYKLAITLELCVAFVALLRPRWAWLLLCLVFLLFDAVLVTQIAGGAASCGCFGSQISIAPGTMLAIDTALLIGLVVTKPWSSLRTGGPNPLVITTALALGVALPWLLDRQLGPGAVDADGQLLEGVWKELDVESWVGRDVWDTPLGEPPLNEHIDVRALPLDGLWVFWRHTCDHCAAHLAELARTETGERFVTLVQLREPHDTEANRVVHEMPAGDFVLHAALPDTINYVITTPAELLLAGGRVVAAQEAVSPEDSVDTER